ncbi:MAG: hypothetical protein Q4F57_06520 [Weeksellaceae bacterium]|nr:hypothetical protein [Weeksellaceae bacterium]
MAGYEQDNSGQPEIAPKKINEKIVPWLHEINQKNIYTIEILIYEYAQRLKISILGKLVYGNLVIF